MKTLTEETEVEFFSISNHQNVVFMTLVKSI